MQRISPEEAVRRAVWMVKVPSMVVLLGPIAVALLSMELGLLPAEGPQAAKWALPTFLGAFIGGWLVWSIQVPRWRLWAYQRVDDIGALKRLAAERQIIWSEGSVFEKTELMSQEVRDELKRLEDAGRRWSAQGE